MSRTHPPLLLACKEGYSLQVSLSEMEKSAALRAESNQGGGVDKWISKAMIGVIILKSNWHFFALDTLYEHLIYKLYRTVNI